MSSIGLSNRGVFAYLSRSAVVREWSTSALVDSRSAERGGFDGSAASLSDLTSAAARGDERAFAALHLRVGTGLRRVLLKRSGGRADLVDDLLQTTWAAVWEALRSGRYDPARGAITTFVYAVGNNAWLTHLRRSGRAGGAGSIGSSDGIERDAVTVEAIDSAMAEAELIDAVRVCVREEGRAGLSEQERVIVRGMAGGESDRALARRLGLSCSTVNVKKQRALEKIREHLTERGLAEEEGSRLYEARRADRANDADRLGPSSAGLAGGVS